MFCDQNMIFTGWVMKRYIGVLILGSILVISLVACGSSDESSSVKDNSPAAPAQAPKSVIEKAPGGKIDTKEDSSSTTSSDGDVTKVKVVNRDPAGTGKYEFSRTDFQFKVGETVEFTISAETEFHTFNVDELGIDKSLSGGETITFTHTFNKAGEFKLYCVPHEANGMIGKIVVE